MGASDAATPRARLPALDAVRAAALLLGICLHASLSFVPGIGAELWPMSDIKKSSVLSVTVFVIHIFRMSVFFFVAGFLARALLERRGFSAFWRDRARRIAVPLVLGWIVCFLLIVAVVLWALARANGGKLPSPLPSAMAESGLNFLHLWFLYLLLWLYAISIALRTVLRAADPLGAIHRLMDRALSVLVSSHLGPVILAAPVAAALFLIKDWNAGMGVPTPGYTLVPPGTSLFIYCYVFMMGWAFDRQRHLLSDLSRRWPVNFGLGLVGALYCLQVTGTDTSFVITDAASAKLLYAVAYAIALMGWTFAFVGAGVRYFATPSPAITYAADASYWMYIAHLPLVMVLQTTVMLADIHWSIKYLFINIACVGLLLVTYHFWVRSTWVGRLLNGKKPAFAHQRIEQQKDFHEVSR
jgi:glucans biosynthesis protein C